MRLVSYRQDGAQDGSWRPGVVVGDSVIDVEAIAGSDLQAELSQAPWSVRRLITASPGALAQLAQDAQQAVGKAVGTINDLTIGPPVPDPDKILCVGLNYLEHAVEADFEAPPAPTIFAKFRNSLIGPGAAVVIPSATKEADYEGEIAVVIGKRCRGVSVADAIGHVAGVMAFNDVSARDLQMQTPQWTVGKAVDTFAPCGPTLVLMDEIADVQQLELTTRLNGEIVQHASATQMIHPVAEVIAFLSRSMTLEPGDIIATGTPAGVGFVREPPLFLKDGDLIEVDIPGVGLLSNPIVAQR